MSDNRNNISSKDSRRKYSRNNVLAVGMFYFQPVSHNANCLSGLVIDGT